MSKVVKVRLWGTIVGYLGYSPLQNAFATFEYDPDFMNSGIQISPVRSAYPPFRHTFDNLSLNSFHGVPGFIADSLPDSFGSRLIDIYMADKGIPASEVSSLDRLLYVSNRGMGALEYYPGETLPLQRTALNLQHLAELAEFVMQRKEEFHNSLISAEDRAKALSVIRIGSSAGGARSKALVAVSPKGRLLDGTVSHGKDYSYRILKFDGSSNRDRDHIDLKGMPVVEYIYSIIARKAGINIPNTELLIDGEDKHFTIERFDRIIRNGKLDKLHYASWAGLAHADRDEIHSYEQLVLLVRKLRLGHEAVTEIFRRAVFNIIGRNQDDHTKNTGFLMNRDGKWCLAPAFDLTYSYDPNGRWTRNHQCRLNNKNNYFNYDDLMSFGDFCDLDSGRSREIIFQIRDAFSSFSVLADEYELAPELKKTVESNLRVKMVNSVSF